MRGVGISLAICACVVTNTGRAWAEDVQLSYETRITMCTALHTAERFTDYPIQLQPEPATAFQSEFDRLTSQGVQQEVKLSDSLEDTVRTFMFVLDRSDASVEQKTAMLEQVMEICDDTFEDMNASGNN